MALEVRTDSDHEQKGHEKNPKGNNVNYRWEGDINDSVEPTVIMNREA